MSQEKAQLIAPQGHFTVPGLNVAGVVTASSFSGDCTGTASSIAQGTNVVVGVMTASSFAGDVFGNAAGLSTTTAGLKLGIVTATSFAGNFTGIGSGLTGTPNIVAGLVTASQFVGNTPGLAGGISAGKNLAAGIVTATTFYGDGSNLTGAGSTAFIRQSVTAQAGTTTINLNLGNIIYLTHSNNTTIAFSNVPTATDITIIRTISANTITWPAALIWNGGSAPTLTGDSTNTRAEAGQVFNLTTADGGTTWYGYEEYDYNPQYYTAYAWGSETINGVYGISSPGRRSSPVLITGDPRWTEKFSVGEGWAVGIKDDGGLWGMGKNVYGQLGQNNDTQYSSPVQVGSDTTWSSVAASGYGLLAYTFTSAIKTDGTLWMWGIGTYGQLGQNNNTGIWYSSPVQVGSDTTWSKLPIGTKGAGTMMAIKTDGTLWVWGNNRYGALGLNQAHNAKHSSPVQLPGTTWAEVSAGTNRSFATKTDGTLWVWGAGDGGRLGLNQATAEYSSPVQLPGTTWNKVWNHGSVTVATKTDGTMWNWGDNQYGQLGVGGPTPSEYSSPEQVPGSIWDTVQTDGNGTIARRTDGTLWTWGSNEFGDLGHNEQGPAPASKVTSPQQIPGTWTHGFSGDRVMFAFQNPS